MEYRNVDDIIDVVQSIGGFPVMFIGDQCIDKFAEFFYRGKAPEGPHPVWYAHGVRLTSGMAGLNAQYHSLLNPGQIEVVCARGPIVPVFDSWDEGKEPTELMAEYVLTRTLSANVLSHRIEIPGWQTPIKDRKYESADPDSASLRLSIGRFDLEPDSAQKVDWAPYREEFFRIISQSKAQTWDLLEYAKGFFDQDGVLASWLKELRGNRFVLIDPKPTQARGLDYLKQFAWVDVMTPSVQECAAYLHEDTQYDPQLASRQAMRLYLHVKDAAGRRLPPSVIMTSGAGGFFIADHRGVWHPPHMSVVRPRFSGVGCSFNAVFLAMMGATKNMRLSAFVAAIFSAAVVRKHIGAHINKDILITELREWDHRGIIPYGEFDY